MSLAVLAQGSLVADPQMSRYFQRFSLCGGDGPDLFLGLHFRR